MKTILLLTLSLISQFVYAGSQQLSPENIIVRAKHNISAMDDLNKEVGLRGDDSRGILSAIGQNEESATEKFKELQQLNASLQNSNLSSADRQNVVQNMKLLLEEIRIYRKHCKELAK